MAEIVRLQRPSNDIPWGFRLAGGRDYQEPLNVQRITPGSIAASELNQGDVIVAISNNDASFMTLSQANDIIKQCGNFLQLSVNRSSPSSDPNTQGQVEFNRLDSISDPAHPMHDVYEHMQDAYRQFDAVSTSMARGTTPSSQQRPGAYEPHHNDQNNFAANQRGPHNVQPPSYAESMSPYGQHAPAYNNARSPTYAGDGSQPNGPPAFPTRLNQQLSGMSLDNDHKSPNYNSTHPVQNASGTPTGYHPNNHTYSPGSPAYNPASPSYSPANAAYNSGNAAYGAVSPTPGTKSPGFGVTSPTREYAQSQPGNATSRSRNSSGGQRRPGDASPGAVPDAVLNMASKSAPDKKPWAYAPDAESIKEQRDKVRRRGPEVRLPSYQNMLNLPQFDEGTPKVQRGLQSPKTPPVLAPKTPPVTSPKPNVPNQNDDGTALAINLQYNTPIHMYSADNVEEALRTSSSGALSPNSQGKKDGGRDITQSDVYKMIHGIDESKQRPRAVPNYEALDRSQSREKTPGNTTDDEIKFSGYNKGEIPSKAFQKLQRMTSNSDIIDTTSIRPKTTENSTLDTPVANYNEASIRYLGATNPSKSFKILQSLTGSDSESEPNRPPSRQRRRRKPQGPEEAEEPQQNADDIVDIRYVGGAIPSRTFKFLQQCVGDTQPTNPQPSYNDYHQPDGAGVTEKPRTIKVIHLRQQQQQPSGGDGAVSEF